MNTSHHTHTHIVTIKQVYTMTGTNDIHPIRQRHSSLVDEDDNDYVKDFSMEQIIHKNNNKMKYMRCSDAAMAQ